MLVGWGFGSPELTLYSYRALESILHVYPGAHVKFITIGEKKHRRERGSHTHIQRDKQARFVVVFPSTGMRFLFSFTRGTGLKWRTRSFFAVQHSEKRFH